MKKVIVAGAGIGGLSAAANLAANGFDVTVIEAKQRNELGYDWRDCIRKNIFEQSGIENPDQSNFEPHVKVCYRNPNKSRKLVSLHEANENTVSIDRQFLAEHLVSYAEKKGAKFIFGTKIMSAVVNGDSVAGVRTENEEILCDLVIDSAGMYSPVRDSLPEEFGVLSTTEKTDTLYVYRAFYEKTTNEMAYPPFQFYFYHMDRKGIDWVITDKKYIDILVGGFEPLTQEKIDEAVADFREEYPYMGEKILRGGQVATIPIGRTLPVIVCNGYVAVGDCAIMIEPLSGSGISDSMRGGKILADTVVGIKDGDYSAEKLWDYQYKYFKECAEKNLPGDILKGFLSDTTARELDYLIEKRILTEKEFSGGSNIKLTVSDIFTKLFFLLIRPAVLMKIVKIGTSFLKVKGACSMMPEKYDKAKIGKWQKKYLKI